MTTQKYFKRYSLIIFVLLAVLLAAVLTSLNIGSMSVKPVDFLRTIFGSGTEQQNLVVFDIRLPRIIIALLVGMALSTAGAVMQSVTHNDLAEPGILGISSGAALFVVIYIYFTNGQNYYAAPQLTIFTMPIIALLGGAFTAAIVYGLSWKRGINPIRFLLMGIAVNAAANAAIVAVQLIFNIKDFNRILMWTAGSIWGANWSYVFASAPIILTFTALIF